MPKYRVAVLLASASLLYLAILTAYIQVEGDATVCFIPVYNASFSNSLNIDPSGSFTFVGSGAFGFSPNGFLGTCLSTNVSAGENAYVYSVFNAKGSFKASFVLKINEGSSFNFTRIILMLADSSAYEVKLGFDDLKIVAYRPDRRNVGATFSTGKWYNLTVWLNASSDTLIILYNGSQTISIPTGVKPYLVKQVNFSIGIIDSSNAVKAFFDEFSMLLSPIMFTDKPVYTSSSSVQVKIVGDQFFASSFDLKILNPSGSVLGTYSITANSTGGFSRTINLTNPSPGTYTMRVNRSGCITEYHFGVWNVPRVWERKSKVTIMAGGFAPNSFVMLSVRNSTHELLSEPERRLNVGSRGEVNTTITVPADLQLGTLNISISYSRTYDFANIDATTDVIKVSVTKAVLNVTIITGATTYERVEPINITVLVKYKDGSSLPWNCVVKLRLVYGGVESREIFMDYSHDAHWFKSIKTNPSDPLGAYLIKVEASDQYDNTGSANRTVTLTAARLRIVLRSQLNETYERSVKLNVSVGVAYPDGTPLASGGVSLEMIRDQYRKGPFNFNKTGLGEWRLSRQISAAEETGEWGLRIVAVDGQGNSGDLLLKIRIVPARLRVELLSPLGSVFSRTEEIPLSVMVKYPSHEAFTLGDGSVNATLLHNGVEQASTRLRFSAGSWVGYISAPRSAPLGQYMLNISAGDPSGNSGSYLFPLEITKAVLSLEIEDFKDAYQIGFETVFFKIVVKYPDDSTLEDGDVSATVSSGSMKHAVSLKYEEGKWVGTYYLPITNPAGDYRVVISAEDPYGNAGVKEVYFGASNLYLILIVISFAIVLAVSVSLLLLRRRRLQFPPAPEEQGFPAQ